MPQIRLTGDCMEEYWWRGFDFETFWKETMSIYYDLEKSYLQKFWKTRIREISIKLVIFSNQTYHYNHTLTITFKHTFIYSDIHLFKSSGLHLLLNVSGMT